MTKHILDHADVAVRRPQVTRYARAARAQMQENPGDRRLMTLSRRASGPWNPAARTRAFLRIARGREV